MLIYSIQGQGHVCSGVAAIPRAGGVKPQETCKGGEARSDPSDGSRILGGTTMAVDEGKLNELLGRFVTDLGGAFHAVNATIGDRLGLYKALLDVQPATPGELAAHAGAGERYVTEWLKGQAAGGYVTYDPATEKFSLTEEQAFALAAPD